ncbi:carotenoid ester lipase precursor [Lentinus tigrinus ALCF2SS1-6]|uniref:Carboxylic ester hydrolase n=2 Tax=Lentinus tigrinus TaxID=5365 RepID=A0A5C2S6M5_9APHY|nr:carotenoid ester lipase precursor [Lentinus tigrinus ALCF2SS1-6]
MSITGNDRVNDLRLRLPEPIERYTGILDATTFGNQCIQEEWQLPQGLPDEVSELVRPILARISQSVPNVTESEDCLNINVVRPTNVSKDAKLPVLVWIYGGGFTYGSNAVPEYNGVGVVKRSIELNEPIIWVAMNYRLNVFGFLGGEQVKKAGVGNLGLQDQRVALRWVNKYIASFGGDPTKVTIWGESAGSNSVLMHMATNGGNTEGLFRAAIMSSGSAPPTDDISDIQDIYDTLVDEVDCLNATDSLACLRGVSVESLSAAAIKIQNEFGMKALYSFIPRADGVFLTRPAGQLVLEGQVAHVPYIIGDVKDKGTLFSIGALNISTDDEFADYVSQQWFPELTVSNLQALLSLYSSDPAAGSPFDTGDANALTPQYKRIAAVLGDWRFHAPRRLLLDATSRRRDAYSFLYARGGLPALGVVHTSDLSNALGPGDMTDYFVRFVNHLDPNGHTGVQWPLYNATSRITLQFNDGSTPLDIAVDSQRLEGTEELTKLSLRFPL